MKNFSKRLVSVVLSLIMAFSVFIIVPSAAAAYDENEKDVSDLSVFLTSSDTANAGNLNDGNEQTKWTPTDSSPYIMVSLPYNIKEVKSVAITAENVEGGITVSASANGFYNYKNEMSASLQNGTYTAQIDASDLRSLKITLPSGASVSKVEITGTLLTVTAKALYNSHKIEWVYDSAENPTFTVERNGSAVTGDTWNTEDVDGYKYYTFLYRGDIQKGDEYVVKANGQEIGRATVKDEAGASAMRKNSLVSADFGPEGMVFEGTAGDQVQLLVPKNDKVTTAKFNAVQYGGAVSTVFKTSTSEKESIATLSVKQSSGTETNDTTVNTSNGNNNNSGYFIGVNSASAGNVYTCLPNGNNTWNNRLAFCGSSGANDGTVKSYAVTIQPSSTNSDPGVYFWPSLDGTCFNSTLHFSTDQTYKFKKFLYNVTSVALGGVRNGADTSDLFNGTVYSFTISEENLGTSDTSINISSDNDTLIEEYNNVKEKIAQAEQVLETADDKVYTKHSIDKLRETINEAKEVLGQILDETADEALINETVQKLQEAKILREIGLEITVAYDGGDAVSANASLSSELSIEHVSSANEDDAPPHLTEENVLSYEKGITDISVKVTASPMVEGLEAEFTAFNEDEEEVTLEENQINESPDNVPGGPQSYIISGLNETTDLFISFAGYSSTEIANEDGTPADSLEVITDNEMLKNHARSNTEQYPAGSLGGDATYAFDGDVGSTWLQRHSTSGLAQGADGTTNPQIRPSNTIGEENCETTTNVNNASGFIGSNGSIWIQTGFDSPRPIGGISYVSDTRAGNNNWRAQNYEIWVSDSEDMENHTVIKSGAFATNTGSTYEMGEQYVLFDVPVTCRYIRLVMSSSHGAFIGADEISIYEYVGVEVNIPVKFKYTDENGEDIQNQDLPPVDIGFNLPVNVLIEKDLETEKETHNVTVDEIQEEFLDGNYQSFIDSIEYNYTIDSTCTPEKSEDGWVCPIKRATALYTLSYTLPEQEKQTVEDVPYGQLFKVDGEFSDTEGLVTADGVTYWTDDDTGAVICSDPYFSLLSSRNMFVTAHTDPMDTTPSAYVYTPVVSRSYVDSGSGEKTIGWKLEIAVKLNNVMRYTSSQTKNHGMVLIDGVDEFGVIIDKQDQGRTSEEIKELLAAGSDYTSLIISKAYVKGTQTEFTPNNKGRYVHMLMTDNTEYNGKSVYSYVKVDGVYYVSNGETLNFPGIA